MILKDKLKFCFFNTCILLVILWAPSSLSGQATLEDNSFDLNWNEGMSYLQDGKPYQCLNVIESIDSSAINFRQWAMIEYLKGAAYVNLNHHDKAYSHLQEALSYFRSINDEEFLAKTYKTLGKLSFLRGDTEQGLDLLRRSLDLYEDFGNLTEVYNIRGNIGILSAQQGDMANAAKEFEAVCSLAAEQGDSNAMVSAYLNLGQLYIRTNRPDSALQYIRTAILLSERHSPPLAKADGYDYLSGYYYMEDQYDSAYYYGSKALKIYENIQPWENAIHVLHRMASSKEKLGDFQEAVQLHWQHIAMKDSAYNRQAQNAIAEAESRFKLFEKNHQIDLLEAHSTAETKQKWLYLALSSLAVSISLIIAFKFKHVHKLRERENKIHRQKIALEAAEKLRLEDELKLKERVLAKESLRMMQKNRHFEELQEKLQRINPELKGEFREDWVAINSSIKYALSVDNDWIEFSQYFESLHPRFQKALDALEPRLTEKEKRLCVLIKINMDTNEIANLLRISPASVKKARQRLRKKLGISHHNLRDFIEELSVNQ
ncbi:MAG: hypothetical protein HWD92_09215 [Flavobacteriia bacterium]|nr:hypothetical protein [Flavobacteriia bacterium]